MIAGNLRGTRAVAVIGARITHMSNDRIPADDIGARPGRGHAHPLRVLLAMGQKRLLNRLGQFQDLLPNLLVADPLELHQPARCPARRVPPGAHCQLAGKIAEAFAPHAVCHDQHVGFVIRILPVTLPRARWWRGSRAFACGA